MIPFLDDFVGVGRDKLLLCSIRALKIFLSWMEKYCPDVFNLLVSTTERREQVTQKTISFWIRLVINHA